MPEEEFRTDNLNNKNEKPESENQVDSFPKTTKLLDTKLKEKKDKILTVLKNDELKKLFEEALSIPEKRQKLISELLENDNTEGVIFANLPEGYAHNISTNEVVKTEVKKTDDFTLAIMRDQQQETVDQQQETVNQQQETVNQQQEKGNQIEAMRRAIEERDRLTDKYKNLASITNANSDNYQTVKQQLENNGVLNQLRESNHDEEFINNYILVQTTLVELKSNPTNYEQSDISFFDKVVKRLDNACNIPDTSLSSFSSENLTQTRTELFNSEVGNDSLISAKKSNMESHDYSDIFPEMGEDELITKYGNFLESPLKEFCQQYQNNPNLKNTINNLIDKQKNYQSLTEEEAQQLKSYRDMISALNSIKAGIEDNTKDMMEELCLISQIKGLSMCIGEENDNEFNFNKAREILDDGNGMTINGHIDGVDFSVRQNAQTNRLQVNSKFIQSKDKNSFDIGRNDNFEDSPFIMPSQEEIFAVISNVVKSDNNINEFESQSSYFENLQDAIMGKMEGVYKDTELAHHYITNKVKGEKVVDSSLGLLRKIKPSIDEKLSKPINQANSGKLFDFVKMLNFNIENSTDTEKDKLCKCISKIMEITDNYRANNGAPGFDTVNYPPIIENFLKNQIWLENGNEDARLGLVFDMLSYYNKNTRDTRTNVEGTEGLPSKVFINDLYRDLFEFSGGESEVCKRRTDEKKEQDDKDEAENLLERNPDIWE